MWLKKLKEICLKESRTQPGLNLGDPIVMRKVMDKTNFNIGQQVEYLLSTGNLSSQSGLDMQQVCLHELLVFGSILLISLYLH